MSARKFDVGDKVMVEAEGVAEIVFVDPDDDVVPYLVTFDGREEHWIDALDVAALPGTEQEADR